MGGRGSGRKPPTSRLEASQCTVIHVDAFRTDAKRRGDLHAIPNNRLHNYRGFVSYRDNVNPKRKIVGSSIAVGPTRQEIFLENTRPGARGSRWYFRCRVREGSSFCNRRADALYLPPGGDEYACRVCHGLTYTRRPRTPRRPDR